MAAEFWLRSIGQIYASLTSALKAMATTMLTATRIECTKAVAMDNIW